MFSWWSGSQLCCWQINRKKIFKNIWVQPAAGDAGGSLGAVAFWYLEKKNTRTINDFDEMSGSYLGPDYSQNFIENELKK